MSWSFYAQPSNVCIVRALGLDECQCQCQCQSILVPGVIYTSRAYATMSVSVCLSVTEVHRRIIATLGFKFRSNFIAHCGRGEGSSQQHLALC